MGTINSCREKLDYRAVTRELDRLVERGCRLEVSKGRVALKADEDIVGLYGDEGVIEEQPYTPLALWDYLKLLMQERR